MISNVSKYRVRDIKQLIDFWLVFESGYRVEVIDSDRSILYKDYKLFDQDTSLDQFKLVEKWGLCIRHNQKLIQIKINRNYL